MRNSAKLGRLLTDLPSIFSDDHVAVGTWRQVTRYFITGLGIPGVHGCSVSQHLHKNIKMFTFETLSIIILFVAANVRSSETTHLISSRLLMLTNRR